MLLKVLVSGKAYVESLDTPLTGISGAAMLKQNKKETKQTVGQQLWSLKRESNTRFLTSGFFTNLFSLAPEYSIGANSNFFEALRRYSKVKVNQRCQRHGDK